MFIEQQISLLDWFPKDHVTLKLNITNDECCIPKCKLKRLKPSVVQLALTVYKN